MKLPPATAKVVAGIFAAAATTAAVTLIPEHEGLRYKAYPDPATRAEPWTICYGHTRGVKRGDVATPEQCVRWAAEDARAHGLDIAKCVHVKVPHQSAVAFVSFAYNVGSTNFCRSGLVRKLNAGDLRGACDELPKWIYGAGKVMPGLVRRRADERALCLSGLR